MAQRPNNLFETSRERVWNAFHDYLEGSTIGAFVIVSSHALSTKAKAALLNSSKALGYDTLNTTLFTLHPEPQAAIHGTTPSSIKAKDDPEQTTHINANSATSTLEPQEIFRIIESLDPLCIVVTDAAATKEITNAFHARLEPETSTTLLGHYCCCFSDFERMLSLETTKQQAWALLKTLKH